MNKSSKFFCQNMWFSHAYLLVELVMIPMDVFLLPAHTAGASDGGTINIKSNCSDPSTMLSLITGTLTLLIVNPLPNVAVSVVVLKSTPPVSQTFVS